MLRKTTSASRAALRGIPLLLVAILAAGAVLASMPAGHGRPAQETDAAAAEDLGDSDASPRGAVRHYLEACRAGEYDRAARYLDLRSIPRTGDEAQPADFARRLKVVLDRALWIDLDALSSESGGERDDGLHEDLERIGTISTRAGQVDVLLKRGQDEGGETIWRFAAATVARIPALHAELGYGVLGELLPERFFVVRFLEIQLWQWLGILLLVPASAFLSWIGTWALFAALRPLVTRTTTSLDDQVLHLTVKPVRFAVALALFAFGALLLRLAVPVQEFLEGLEKGLAIVAVAWLFLRIIDLLSGRLRARLEREGKLAAVAALPLGERAVKILMLALAFVALVQNLGFDVTGLVAGLGIGGLAVALAAQKTVENLFGGASLILDQPVRVGDFCRYGDKLGTVEDVGLRTTRIRSLDRTVVSVPNAEFANLALENFARRDKILFRTKLGLRYETTPDQLRWVLAEIRRLLLAHPRVEPDPGRVRFVGYGAYSLDLEIFAFVATPDINDYLAIQEDILLRIMDIVRESGTGFAFPSSTTYLARDGGNDEQRTVQAEERVRAWRDGGRLPFPDYPPEVKAEIDDTVDYPPRGSAAARA